MSKVYKLINISGEVLNIKKEFSIAEEYTLERETRALYQADDIYAALENEQLKANDGDEDLTIKTAIAVLKKEFYSSLAVDKNGTDQTITGDEWEVVTAQRVLWDIESNYDADTDDIVIPYDGIYSFDGQIKLTNISAITKVELALFKRGTPDDYWFILDEKPIAALQTEALLSFATFFDFYEDERYTFKIKLYGLLPSATIDGEDDYTAWGYSFSRSLHG